MYSKIWRFSFDNENFKNIIQAGILHFPEINPSSSIKYNTQAKIIADLRVGHFVILANFNSFESTGIIKAIGKITNICENEIKVSWKKLVPSWSLHPHKIGAEQWIRESVFFFNVPRVREFKLDSLAKKMFPEK